MIDLYIAARERGKYLALGGHKATLRVKIPGWDGAAASDVCGVCGRPVTDDWRGVRHASQRRRRS